MILNNFATHSRRLLAAVAIAALAGVGLVSAAASAQEPTVRPGVTIDYDLLDALGIDPGPVVAAVAALVR